MNHIKDNIRELSDDIQTIERITSQTKDKDIEKLCNEMCVKLRCKLEYFEKKFEVIKIINKAEENEKFENYYTDQF